jgi:hypothetical protein
MDKQDKPTPGHRGLTQAEVDLVTEIRAIEANVNGLIDRMRATPDLDQRNIALGQTYAEDTFSRLVRAIARPERQVA